MQSRILLDLGAFCLLPFAVSAHSIISRNILIVDHSSQPTRSFGADADPIDGLTVFGRGQFVRRFFFQPLRRDVGSSSNFWS